MSDTKYCKHCGQIIDMDCIICPKCGKQVEEITTNNKQPIIINSSSSSSTTINTPMYTGNVKNKWISLLLCIFTVCGHKFYEGKIVMGLIYLFTGGLFAIGWFIDIIILLGKPEHYYV